LCVQIELNKLLQKDSVQSVNVVLNQILDMCLKNEQVKEIIIEVAFLVLFEKIRNHWVYQF